MTAIPYEQFEDDIGITDADDLSVSTECDEAECGGGGAAVEPPGWQVEKARGQMVGSQLGWLHLITGLILTLLGVAQVVILPLLFDRTGKRLIISLDRLNSYGVAIWAGLLMVLSGSLAVRSAWHNSISALYIFFCLVLAEIAVFASMLLFLLVSYAEHWTTRRAYDGVPGGGALFAVQLAVAILLVLAFLFLLHAFLKFYEAICCSAELQLCKRVVHCCLPCLCPRVVSAEDLMTLGRERPPSLPI